MDYILDVSITGTIMPLIIGVVLVLYSVHSKRKISKLKRSGLEAEGIIFDLSSGGRESNDTVVVRFVTKDNVWITKEPSTYFSQSGLNLIRKGDKVKVFYNPDNPDDFVIIHSSSKYFFIAIILGGLIFAAYGLYSAYKYLTE